jgi:hypothetical protein
VVVGRRPAVWQARGSGGGGERGDEAGRQIFIS